MERFDDVCGGRRIFVTQQGYIGIGPQSLIKGDTVCIFDGVAVCFIMRLVRWFHGDGQDFPSQVTEEW